MKTAVIACLHGDEKYGLKVIEELPSSISFFIGNPKALLKNKSFIDTNLNRCFPGNPNGTYEEKRAYDLFQKLKKFDYVIDLHSSSNSCPLFGIITKPNQEKIELAKKLGLRRLVIMPEYFASGKALIDFVKCGISLEIGPHERKKNAEEVTKTIQNLIENKPKNEIIEIFEVFKIIKKQQEKILIANFKPVKKGQTIAIGNNNQKQRAEFDFIPVLVNEKSYKNVLCLACKKLYKLSKLDVNMKKEGKFKVTPYEVTGKVDYSKLIKQFGVSKLDDKLLNRIKKHTKELHLFLRRKVFFSHRDLNWLLDEYEKGNKFFLYTGRASSKGSKVHIGHLIPWILCKWLQDKFNVEMWFQFPDEEKFLYKQEVSLKDTEKATYEDMLDVIALGFKPGKTHFLIDTKHANLMYKEACKVAKKITFSTIKSSFGFNDSNNIGSIFYTAMQAVPAFLPSVIKKKNIPCLIPLGIDQDTHFRISRDVMPKLGFYKPAILHSVFLPPLTGVGGKMSSSRETSIFTTDTPKQVEEKIKKYAFSGGQATTAEHRKKGGNPDIDVSFQYLKMFFEPDDAKLKRIEQDYKSGKLLTSELKEYLIKKINAFLKKHQQEREKAKKQVGKFIFQS